MSVAVSVLGVTFAYRGSSDSGLRDVSLEVAGGECVVLCGKSGCGKSTLLRLVNGMIPNFCDGVLEGRVSVCGIDPFDAAMWRVSDHVGSVFQNPRTQFYTTDAQSEVAFACECAGMPRDEIARRVDGAFRDLGIEGLRGRGIFDLSGGEKQIVALAGAYARDPDVYVLDEPSSNLDEAAMHAIGEALARVKAQGKAVIVAEHRIGYLEGVADRALLLEDGRVQGSYSLADLAAFDRERRLATGVRAMGVPRARGRARREVGEGIEAVGMRFSYRRRGPAAFDVDSIAFEAGCVTAILGRNGAGKSTLVSCMTGLERRARGTCKLAGTVLSARERLRESYLVLQDVNHQMFCDGVRAEVALGARDADEKEVARLLAELDLCGLEDRHPSTLSGGQKQRVAVASALISGKRALFFDEPTSGLDFSHMVQTAALLRTVADKGAVVVVVTHDLELVAECCDRFVRLHEGRVADAGTVDDEALVRLASDLG